MVNKVTNKKAVLKQSHFDLIFNRNFYIDLYTRLNANQSEVTYLLRAMLKGDVSGSFYAEKGCGCFVGTIAKGKGYSEKEINEIIFDNQTNKRADIEGREVKGFLEGYKFIPELNMIASGDSPVEKAFELINLEATPFNDVWANIIFNIILEYCDKNDIEFDYEAECQELDIEIE